ncbi:MAG: ruvA [Gammaproteobacteria bacterium]|jgi:Holliday junction DNA helicase RuvA|nr:ruvA [Gammaproteobacteria bacterium]MCE3237159.1 ruvA [Gammaproteobacteria bacterium]
MISQLRGILLEKQPPQLLLDVHGIAYEIDAPMSTFYRLPDKGKEIVLHTHFVVREDAHHLYGFYAREERALFRTLLKVNGVGPRLGLTILSSMDPTEFVRCIMNHDTTSLVHLPGVGKKTAERLVIEMRDKLSDWQPILPSESASLVKKPETRNRIIQDAISAMVALGYKPAEASRAVAKVDDNSKSSEEIIRQALKEMV